MGNAYDDAKYGVIERKTFGLTQKHGGDAAAGFTFNETESTKVTKWYPKGPIQIQKFGTYALATLGKGEQLFGLALDGTRLTQVTASTTSAPYAIASVAVDDGLSSGSYLTINASTNVCSTGTCALFIDFRRKYDSSGWDATS